MLVLGLSFTAVAAFATWRVTVESESAALSSDGQVVASLLSETMDLGVTQVRSMQAFFEASESVSAVEFSRFALRQGHSPGLAATGYAPVVSPDEFEDFQASARADRQQYVVVDTDRKVIQAAEDRDLVPVWYSHQKEIGPPILGVDLASDPLRRQAIERAIESREPALTDQVEVLGDTEHTYVEIYAAIPTTSTQSGVVFASIDILGLLSRADREVLGGATLDVSDVTGVSTPGSVAEPERWTSRVGVGDREWRVQLTRDLSWTDRPLLLSVVVGGVAISVLIAVVSRMVGSSRSRSRQLQQMIRNTSEKDVFLASVAHELRTPLTSVVGIAALLSENWRELPDREVDELLSISHAEASDLGDLIEDLLVAGRIQAGAIHYRAEPVDLSQEVRRVVSRLNTEHEVLLDIPHEDRLVHADPLRVRQIVRNIVVNGVRHATSTVTIRTARDGGKTALMISNDGSEIPRDLIEVLFRPYQEGRDRKQPGSIGLGLPVSRKLAEMMDGRLEYSYDAGWCTFTLWLPAASNTDDGSALAPHTSTQTRLSSSTG